MAKKNLFFLTPEFIRQLRELIKWRRNFSVTGAEFTNTPTSASLIIAPPKNAKIVAAGDRSFWAIVTAATQDGDNFRWTYTMRRVGPKTDLAWSGWAGVEPDLTGYNTLEILNDGTPTNYGNGVASADLGVDDELLPAPVGSIYRVWPVGASVEETNETEYWFEHENALHVVCPE